MTKYVVKRNSFVDGWSVYYEPPKREDTTDPMPWRRVPTWFDTWREAMDYADRRARTVEVVLPRRTVLPTVRHTVHRNGLIIEFSPSKSHPQLNPGHVVVEPEERRPLALALLALAEKEEKHE